MKLRVADSFQACVCSLRWKFGLIFPYLSYRSPTSRRSKKVFPNWILALTEKEPELRVFPCRNRRAEGRNNIVTLNQKKAPGFTTHFSLQGPLQGGLFSFPGAPRSPWKKSFFFRCSEDQEAFWPKNKRLLGDGRSKFPLVNFVLKKIRLGALLDSGGQPVNSKDIQWEEEEKCCRSGRETREKVQLNTLDDTARTRNYTTERRYLQWRRRKPRAFFTEKDTTQKEEREKEASCWYPGGGGKKSLFFSEGSETGNPAFFVILQQKRKCDAVNHRQTPETEACSIQARPEMNFGREKSESVLR